MGGNRWARARIISKLCFLEPSLQLQRLKLSVAHMLALCSPLLRLIAGSPEKKVTEEDGKRYTHSTGQFAGTELHLYTEVRKGV